MRKLKIAIVVLCGVALFFMGMSILADKTTTVGLLIPVIASSSLFFACVLFMIRAIMKNKNR